MIFFFLNPKQNVRDTCFSKLLKYFTPTFSVTYVPAWISLSFLSNNKNKKKAVLLLQTHPTPQKIYERQQWKPQHVLIRTRRRVRPFKFLPLTRISLDLLWLCVKIRFFFLLFLFPQRWTTGISMTTRAIRVFELCTSRRAHISSTTPLRENAFSLFQRLYSLLHTEREFTRCMCSAFFCSCSLNESFFYLKLQLVFSSSDALAALTSDETGRWIFFRRKCAIIKKSYLCLFLPSEKLKNYG